HAGRDRESSRPTSRPDRRSPPGNPIREPRDQNVVRGARVIRNRVIERGERAGRPTEIAHGEVRIERALLDGRKLPAPAARKQILAAPTGLRAHRPTSRISLSSGLAWIRS